VFVEALSIRHLFAHADGVLGLVEHRVVAVGVLLAGGLVARGLGAGLLAVGDDVTAAGCQSLFEAVKRR